MLDSFKEFIDEAVIEEANTTKIQTQIEKAVKDLNLIAFSLKPGGKVEKAVSKTDAAVTTKDFNGLVQHIDLASVMLDGILEELRKLD